MYNLRKKKDRFMQISNLSFCHYDSTEADGLKKFMLATGVLNHIWQSWNSFWRCYWIAHVAGGKDLKSCSIAPLKPGFTEPQAIYHLLMLLGRKKAGSTGLVLSSKEEVTWGHLRTIQDLAYQLQSPANNIADALSASTLFGSKIDHFQSIRNAQIHISTSNMKGLSSVIPYYVVSSKPKYPYEIIEAREITSGKVAIKAWVENMNDFIGYL